MERAEIMSQLLFGDAQTKGLFQIGHDGQDLHRGQIQIIHHHAVFVDILGRDLCHILQNSRDLVDYLAANVG